MGEEGEEVADVDAGWTSCCCLALASSIVATCCLTNERAEAEIENKARKEEKRRREFKKIQEDIRRKEEKRRDDERRRKEERRRKDEKKRIEKQQKEEKTKRRENDEVGGGHIACGTENIQKLQVVRAANPDINRRDKIQWENKPGNEKHEIAAKVEVKTTHSTAAAVQGNGGDRIDRVGMKQFDNRPNLSAGDDQSLQKMNNNKLQHTSNHSLLADASSRGGGAGQQQGANLGTKRLQSMHSFDSSRTHPSAGEGHQRERLRSIHSLDNGGGHHSNNGQIGQHQHGQMQQRRSHQGQHGPSNGNGMRDHMTAAAHQQQIQQKKALAQRQKSSSSGENKNVKKSSSGKLGPGKKK